MQAVPEEEAEIPEGGEIDNEQIPVDTEEDTVTMRGDNLPIVYLSRYHTEENSISCWTWRHISKTATDLEMTRARSSMRRE